MLLRASIPVFPSAKCEIQSTMSTASASRPSRCAGTNGPDCRSSMIDWSRTTVRRVSRGNQMMIDDRRCTLPLGIMIDCPGTLMQRILHNSQHANRDLNVATSQPPARRTNALMASPATRTPMAPVPALRAPFATRTTFGCPRDARDTTAATTFVRPRDAPRPINDGCPRGVVHRLLAR